MYEKVDTMKLIQLTILLLFFSCSSKSIEIIGNQEKYTLHMKLNTDSQKNSAKSLWHIYCINMSSGMSYSSTTDSAENRELTLNNLTTGYYDVYCYSLQYKSETQLYIDSLAYSPNYPIDKNKSEQITLLPLIPITKINITENNTELIFNMKNWFTSIYISSMTLKNINNKFVKFTTTISDSEITTLSFNNFKISNPAMINISFTNRGKIDKEYFNSIGLSITTTRFENFIIHDTYNQDLSGKSAM